MGTGATEGRGPIVVGVDGSGHSRLALFWAADEAHRRDAPLRLVHAWLWPMYRVPLGPAPGAPAGAGLQAEAERLLGEAAAEARQRVPSIEVETQLVTGDPSATLIRSATDASLLVVGSRGLGGFASLLVGSVGVQVTSHAPCPTAVVRGDPFRRGPVIVGVDGSERSEQALAAAFAEARLRGASLVGIHAWEPPPAWLVGLPSGRSLFAAREEAAKELLSDMLEPWLAGCPDVVVESRAMPGSPAGALVRASREGQVLVMGTRGRGGFAGLLLGSTTHAAVHHAECPVLAVRSPADEGQEGTQAASSP